jgi:hypothetical protein
VGQNCLVSSGVQNLVKKLGDKVRIELKHFQKLPFVDKKLICKKVCTAMEGKHVTVTPQLVLRNRVAGSRTQDASLSYAVGCLS